MSELVPAQKLFDSKKRPDWKLISTIEGSLLPLRWQDFVSEADHELANKPVIESAIFIDNSETTLFGQYLIDIMIEDPPLPLRRQGFFSETAHEFVNKLVTDSAIYIDSSVTRLFGRYLENILVIHSYSGSSKARPENILIPKLKRAWKVGDVSAARKIIQQIPESDKTFEVRQMGVALAHPKVFKADKATGNPIRGNSLWIKKNKQRYRGTWVALSSGQLVDKSKDRGELRARLVENNLLADATIIFVE